MRGSESERERGARLVIVCGLPGSGKTTLALRLEREMAAVRLSADDWMTELGHNLHEETMRARIEALQWRLAKRLLVLGGAVVVEWGVLGPVGARSPKDRGASPGGGGGAALPVGFA